MNTPKKTLISTESNSSSRPLEELATGGRGVTWQQKLPEEAMASMRALLAVAKQYVTKIRKLTTSTPLSPLPEASLDSIHLPGDYLCPYPDFRCCAPHATQSKPEGKMNDAKPIGVKHDQEKLPLHLLSPYALEEVGKVLAFGAKKYAARNWENGIAYSRIMGAILRHTMAYLRGERLDKETGLSHAAHICCEAMFLVHFEQVGPRMDDLKKEDQ
jgi:hypothetical protein